MNFMHEINPCAAQVARRIDGSIDIAHYEWKARRARQKELRTLFAALRRFIAPKSRPASRRAFREA